VLPANRLPAAVAFISATLGFGGAISLPASAWVAQHYGYHVLFAMAGTLGVVALAMVWWLVPASTERTPGTFDLPGAIALALGLAGVLLAVSKGSEWGWTSSGTLGCGIGGLAVLIGFGFYEVRLASPLVDLRVAARPAVLLTNLASIALGFALFASSVAIPELLELPTTTGVGPGQTVFIASLCLVPGGFAMMAMAPVAARTITRYGARFCLALGGGVIVLSYLFATFFATQLWEIVVINILSGLGVGLAYSSMPTLIMRAVPSTETAAANGLNALMRSLGTTSAAAVIGLVLVANSSLKGGITFPSPFGFQLGFVLGGAAAVVSVVITLFIPTRLSSYAHVALPPKVVDLPT
jgi:predicted MFS family arabinose efflux permease